MTRLWLIVTAVAAVVVCSTMISLISYSSGKRAGKAEMLTRSVEILRERSRTDEEIRGMDDVELCNALGGVFADGTCQ